MPVNNCILEYVKKEKNHYADFFLSGIGSLNSM